MALVHEIEGRIPSLDDISSGGDESDELATRADPMMVVLATEAEFFRDYIEKVRRMLTEMEQTPLDADPLESPAIAALVAQNVPEKWRTYPAPTAVQDWLEDLTKRVEFFNNWVRRGKPASFWLGAFAEPKAFMNMLVMRTGRAFEGEDFQAVDFDVEFCETEPQSLPESQVCLHGIAVNGARWNDQTKLFDVGEAEGLGPVPRMKLSPVLEPRELKENEFLCPLYLRTGEKSELLITVFRIMTNKETIASVRAGVSFYIADVST
jgi:hypothetical protein